MTVKEFIEALKLENQDAEVYVEDWNEGYAEPHLASINGYVSNPSDTIACNGGRILLIGA